MNRIRIAALGLVLVLACSRTPKLDGAKAEIPVFSPSSLDNEHTATTSDDVHDIMKYRTHTWVLSTKASWEEVDAFYRERLPAAKREDETSPVAADESALDREVRYTWVPDGWTGGAKVMVLIDKKSTEKTKLEIVQDVLNR